MKKKNRSIFSRRVRSYMLIVCTGVLLYFLLYNFNVAVSFGSRLLSAVSPFISGAILAFLIYIPIGYFERTLYKKLKRRRLFSILTSYIITIGFISLFSWLVAPQLIESTRSLLGNANQYLDNLNNLMDYLEAQFHLDPEILEQFRISYGDLINQLLAMAYALLPDIIDLSVKVGAGIITAITALIASVYMVISKDMLLRQCRRALFAFVPRGAANELRRILRLTTGVFVNFISGKIVESIIVGFLCFAGMYVIDRFFIEMPFMLLISVIVMVTNVIPFFGPFIGAIPSAMILLMINPMSALWFIIFIVVLQQFDGNYLGPRILGDSTGLPPIWVLVAIIVGGGLFGVPGMIAGVPAIAVVHTLVHELVDKRLKEGGFDPDANYMNNGIGSDANYAGQSAGTDENSAGGGAEPENSAQPPGDAADENM